MLDVTEITTTTEPFIVLIKVSHQIAITIFICKPQICTDLHYTFTNYVLWSKRLLGLSPHHTKSLNLWADKHTSTQGSSNVWNVSLDKKATIHQLTTMLSTSKNVLFPGQNHLITSGADDPSLYHRRWHSVDNQSAGSSALMVGNRTF